MIAENPRVIAKSTAGRQTTRGQLGASSGRDSRSGIDTWQYISCNCISRQLVSDLPSANVQGGVLIRAASCDCDGPGVSAARC